MKTIKDFLSVVDIQTLVVTLLAVASTWICLYFNVLADIPTGLIGLAVVFPIVFSINAAYKRREDALKAFSGIKAHAVSLYYVHRDWVPGDQNKKAIHSARMRALIEAMLGAIRADLVSKGRDPERLQEVYGIFSRVSASLETLRASEMSAGEVSRANQYLSKIMIDYEKMRNIATYRTPVTLRAYSRVFLNTFPIAFGPYFATLCTKSESFPQAGYMVAVLYSLVLVTLDNLQEDIEDPYDEVGADDIHLDAGRQYQPIIEA